MLNSKRIKIIITIVFIISISLCSCTVRERIHYLDKSKYVTSEGTVTSIRFSDKYGLLMEIEGLEEIYGGIRFEICGTNYQIVLDNGIEEKLSVGQKIEFTASPGVFGDGYYVPIVYIRIDGEEFLSFEDGYRNLIKEHSNWG